MFFFSDVHCDDLMYVYIVKFLIQWYCVFDFNFHRFTVNI